MFVGNIFDGATTGIDVGDIGHSLRFAASRSCYASITLTTSATATYFGVLKRGKLGVVSPIIDSYIKFNANDTMTAFGLTTTAVFRDPSSWLFWHVSNNGLYVNGAYLGAVTTSAITNPRIGYDGTNYFDGYMARVGCVDGAASSYSNFGYLNTDINEWVSKSQSAVKAVVDAGGTNSFMLDFDNGTSLTTLGYDKSSKGNNWTLNNFSLTAGVNYDWMLDVPGNSYATLNPIIPSAANISKANLASGTTAVQATLSATAFTTSGAYWEVTAGGSAVTAGVINDSGTTNTTTVTANKTFGFRLTNAGALDYINITDAGSWTGITTGLTGNRYPYGTTAAADWNFGQRPFVGTASGQALCQSNMPDVPAAYLNPRKHADVVTRTGTAATYSVSGLQFAPDFLWAKSRGRAVDHAIYDSVRGVQKQLESNTTTAETTESTGLTAFNSDGYTGGALDQINGTTATNSFVDWLLKAGGAGVTNNVGSISSQVSANQDTGFSIVTYTGTGANATVGHGCKVNGVATAPGLVIIKCRTSGTTYSWCTYHQNSLSNPANRILFMNNTDAATTDYTTILNNTAPSSTVISVGTASGTNESGKSYVAYCFAPGFFSIGSVAANGALDNSYVATGHKSRWLMTKRVDAAGSWIVWDSARSASNVSNLYLLAESSAAEGSSGGDVDFLSNGFKFRVAASGTYIYLSIPDVFAKFSLAR